ncbi:hypothetical protein NW801_00100 [Brevibacillus laterosporus]|uniref:Uncharacterized protein n=1 Tax=Brevibacillus halotolerans TaxID=1507437 RepID=A0ABT4HRA9_9BACL|nr:MULTISPECIES: hypothetical protein [Brevibacillus]MCR8983475.1 hypothetical protein [Brevibacillus laterosporus]MCZ0829192.1 hypothetical protein [Brevibacillus halotolerans]
MKAIRLLSTLVLTLSLGISGFGYSTPSTYAQSSVSDSTATQTKPALEHMKIFRLTLQTSKTPDSFKEIERWYDPMNGYEREDEYRYFQSNKYQKESITTKKNITKPKEKPDKTLFETIIEGYQVNKVYWKPIGEVELNGKKVKKYQSLLDTKDASYEIVYVDVSTGLPVKVEGYDYYKKLYQTNLFFLTV